MTLSPNPQAAFHTLIASTLQRMIPAQLDCRIHLFILTCHSGLCACG
jgi:hypothetical protein